MKMQKQGQSLTEYGIVMALVLVVGVVGVKMLGQTLNGQFSGMLSAPPGTTAGSSSNVSSDSNSNQDELSAVTDISTNTMDHTAGDKKKPAAQRKPKLSKEDLLLEKYRKITPQVAGGLGDEDTMFGDSNKLVKQAMKYKKTDPETFNALVKLGIQGKKMAKSMATYQNTNASQDLDVLMDRRGKYENKLVGITSTMADKKLSAKDQAKVDKLGWNSADLAYRASKTKDNANSSMCLLKGGGWSCLGVYMRRLGYDANQDASKTVDSNSNQIIHCGKQGKCKK